MNSCFGFMETLACLLILLLAVSEIGHAYDYTARSFQDTTFDVTKFGATGDGKTDDSKAFQSAWQAACGSGSNTKIIVPDGKTYLLFPIEFDGPCKCSQITFEILGKIVAPPKSAWKKILDEWLCFHDVDRLIVVGNGQGVIDGEGSSWWGKAEDNRPTALRFKSCNNLQISGLKYINSPKNHVSINSCDHANISSLHLIAPETSPNTDGIDISFSTNIIIDNCTMETGDDCIAINAGTAHVFISNINCGPGHGISIGSLGSDGSNDTAEDIHVNHCTFTGTQNGARIKTWPKGYGFVKNISFSDIHFTATDNPVIINQQYCPDKSCKKDKGSYIKISDVRYTGLRGTSICTKATINFDCSQLAPCIGIVVNDVNIEPADPHVPSSAQCINAHGIARNCTHPTVNCLKP